MLINEGDIATVDNTQARSINRPLIPNNAQTDSPNFPNRTREPLNSTNKNIYNHQRSESTRIPESERRQPNNPGVSRINENIRDIYERHRNNQILVLENKCYWKIRWFNPTLI